MREFTEQELVRREKLEFLKGKGLDPFGSKYDVNTTTKELKEKYENSTVEDLEEIRDNVSIAGRIITKRGKGKAGFINLQDKYGQIQIYVKLDNVGEEAYEIFDKSDLGDIVGIEGEVMRTHMGELSIRAKKFQHLVKALRPLPDKFHGLQDIEERYRRRYVDLIVNEEARKIAFTRPKIIRCIQSFLDGEGYTEVETPVLTTLLTGASARPFVTHHNTQDVDMYLRIALELPLKRLLVGGMERVYEIGRVFRNEGMDPKHNPEFTLLEAYCAYNNLEGMMDMTEKMFTKIAKEVI